MRDIPWCSPSISRFSLVAHTYQDPRLSPPSPTLSLLDCNIIIFYLFMLGVPLIALGFFLCCVCVCVPFTVSLLLLFFAQLFLRSTSAPACTYTTQNKSTFIPPISSHRFVGGPDPLSRHYHFSSKYISFHVLLVVHSRHSHRPSHQRSPSLLPLSRTIQRRTEARAPI